MIDQSVLFLRDVRIPPMIDSAMCELPRKTKGKPDPVDLNAAAILHAFRAWRGLSQDDLGKAIGVTFQQIQKYEKGINRMSASALYRLSRALDVSVIEFFSGLEGVWPDTGHLWLAKDEIKLLELYRNLREPGAQEHIMALAKKLSRYRLDGDD